MWTLSSNDPSEAKWELTHQVLLAEIWNNETYKRTPLRPEVIPTVALVSPIKAHEVYFFLDEHIFCVDLLSKSVAQCEEFKGWGMPDLSSRLVHAWQFPPELAEYQPLPGTDESNATWVYVLNRYDSVQDFHGQLLAARDRWFPEWFDMGMDKLEEEKTFVLCGGREKPEEDGDDASEMSEDLEEGWNDSETSEEDIEEDGDD